MPDKPNNPFQFWQELKRRKVIRVIPVYAAASFVLLELVDIITEPFGLPDSTLKFVFVLLCVGFIIAIILSWVYDVTPEGVKKTKPIKEVQQQEPVKPIGSTTWKITTYISVVIIVALVVFQIVSSKKQVKDLTELEKSIAVLPFENWNSDKKYAYFGDAMTDEIIMQLQKIKEFRVISRTSTIQYKDSKPTIPQIGEELNVNYLVEGTVQRQGDDIRIRVQVIRTKNEDHIWGDIYDKEWKDIFYIQSDVAKQIAHELKTILSPEEIEQIEKKLTENLEAYEYYLLGIHSWNTRTGEGLIKAIEFFEKAIEEDPSYALAYSGMADCYIITPLYANWQTKEAYPRARDAAIKALELDSMLAEAHTSLAAVKFFYEWDWSAADKEFKRAIKLNPSYATAHHWYGILIRTMWQFDEAIAKLRLALELDPLSLILNNNLGECFYFAGRYDEAIEQFCKTLEIDSTFVDTHIGLGKAYLQKGMFEEAIEAFPKLSAYLVYAYMVIGKRNEALAVLKELKEISTQRHIDPLTFAVAYLGAGEIDMTFEALEKAYQEHSIMLFFINNDPFFNSIRLEPRFIQLLKKMGLEE